MASSLRYSWEFKEIICVDNNKAKNNFITPYEIVFGLVVVNTNDLFEFSTVYKIFLGFRAFKGSLKVLWVFFYFYIL